MLLDISFVSKDIVIPDVICIRVNTGCARKRWVFVCLEVFLLAVFLIAVIFRTVTTECCVNSSFYSKLIILSGFEIFMYLITALNRQLNDFVAPRKQILRYCGGLPTRLRTRGAALGGSSQPEFFFL